MKGTTRELAGTLVFKTSTSASFTGRCGCAASTKFRPRARRSGVCRRWMSRSARQKQITGSPDGERRTENESGMVG
ncbi:hypothetical protein KCP78_22935 [Salmonella enterica subsp. enterica]|nr:hypothetical protein KCP78_22935 [Salmonella enterica subsp. enterica]